MKKVLLNNVYLSKKKGITVLTLVILISAIGLTLAMEGLVLSKNQVESNLVEMDARRAEQNAVSCVDYAIEQLKADNAYDPRLASKDWTPSEITTALWLDASDASTFSLNGSNVSEWRDKSTNSRHAVQTNATYQPVLSGGSVNFDGSDDFFNINLDFLAGVSHSAFIVAKMNTYTNIYGATNGGNGANSLHIGFENSTYGRMNFWGNDYGPQLNSYFLSGAFNILNYVWMSGASKTMNVNGYLVGTSAQQGVIGTMSGGGRINGVVYQGYANMEIKEMVFVLDGNITNENKEKLEGYLAHKWGFEVNLPTGHTYKARAPMITTGATNLITIDATNTCTIDNIFGTGNEDRIILTSSTVGNVTKKKTAKINTLVPSVSIDYVRDQEESDLQDIPVIKSVSPASGSVDVDPTDALVINFSKPVVKGSGNIEIRKVSDDSLVESINVGDAPLVNRRQIITQGEGTTNPVTATFSIVPREGNLLVVVVGNRGDPYSPTISGSGWTLASWNSWGNFSNRRNYAIFYKVAGSSEPTSITVNCGTTSSSRIIIQEFESNMGGFSYVGQNANNSGDSGVTSLSSNNVSVGAGTYLLIGGYMARDNAGNMTYGQGFGNGQNFYGSEGVSTATAFKVDSTAGDKSVTFGSQNAVQASGGIVAFKMN
jgi:hypothetical protein